MHRSHAPLGLHLVTLRPRIRISSYSGSQPLDVESCAYRRIVELTGGPRCDGRAFIAALRGASVGSLVLGAPGRGGPAVGSDPRRGFASGRAGTVEEVLHVKKVRWQESMAAFI